MSFAGLFFAFSAISGTSSAILEYKFGNNNKIRKIIQVYGNYISLGMFCLVGSVFTYKEIPVIDRRPPLVIGEFAGVLSFVFQSITMMPLLGRTRE